MLEIWKDMYLNPFAIETIQTCDAFCGQLIYFKVSILDHKSDIEHIIYQFQIYQLQKL